VHGHYQTGSSLSLAGDDRLSGIYKICDYNLYLPKNAGFCEVS